MTSDALYGILASAPNLNGAKIYPIDLPERAPLPAIIYTGVGGSSKRTLTTTGAQRRRVQITCVADQPAGGYRAADVLRESMRAYLDSVSNQRLSDGTNLQNIEFIQPLDLPFWNDAREYRCAAEFYFYFNFPS